MPSLPEALRDRVIALGDEAWCALLPKISSMTSLEELNDALGNLES